MTRVLVVEDEESFSDALSYMLRREGYEVEVAETGPQALTAFDRSGADLVLLDLMLPGLSGTEVCRELRSRSKVPIIMVTARDTEVDKVVGLELGADDYVTKPFSPRELTLRIQAILRRGPGDPAPGGPRSYGGGELVIDEDRHRVAVRGDTVELTPTEWGVLTALASVPGRVYSRYELINRVRGYEFEGYERTIDSHVKNLRRKI